MKWIDIKEKLPPKKDILVFGECGSVHIGHFLDGNHYHIDWDSKNSLHCKSEKITHWMSLPENPPKKKEV